MSQGIHPTASRPPSTQARIPSALNVIAGLYLLISTVIHAVNGGNRANGIVFGIIVAILAASRLAGAGIWASWLNALIGIWLIISPWIYGSAGRAWMWNSIVLGIIVLILALWSTAANDTADVGSPPG